MKNAQLIACLAVALAAPAAQAQPAQAQAERVWSARYDPKQQPILVYGTPDTADAQLTATCMRKTGQVTLNFPVGARPQVQRRGQTWVDKAGRPPPWPISVSVATPAQRTTVPGLSDVDQIGGGSSVRVELATRAPVLQDLGKPQPLQLQALNETVSVPAPPKRLIRKFLKDCR